MDFFGTNDIEHQFSNRFGESFIEQIRCVVCQEVKFNLKMCEICKNLQCDSCFEKMKEKGLTCSMCHNELKLVNLDKNTQNLLNKVKLKCLYFNKGCPELISFEKIKYHIEDCEYKDKALKENAFCKYCKVEFKIDDFYNHIYNKEECFKNIEELLNEKDNVIKAKENEVELYNEKHMEKVSNLLEELSEKDDKLNKLTNIFDENKVISKKLDEQIEICNSKDSIIQQLSKFNEEITENSNNNQIENQMLLTQKEETIKE